MWNKLTDNWQFIIWGIGILALRRLWDMPEKHQ
jgi:hypothetical protein